MEYHIATTGNDSNSGTLESPFKTIEKLETLNLVGGDNVFIHKGTYKSTKADGVTACTRISSRNGTKDKPIVICAYPQDFVDGGRVVYDCSNLARQKDCYGITVQGCSYIIFGGIYVKGPAQTAGERGTGSITGSWWSLSSSYNNFNNCEASHGMSGFRLDDGTDTTFKNCDAHECDDPFTGPPTGKHNNSDGFMRTAAGNMAQNTKYIGCRSYWNSDDGWDCYGSSGNITYENCWAFWNGYKPGAWPLVHVSGSETYGDGNGIKMGPGNAGNTRRATGCLSVSNFFHGFDQNAGSFTATFYNNTSYNNQMNDWKYGYNPPIPHVFRNNISYKCKILAGTSSDATAWVQDHNSWNGGSVSDADFVSLDEQQLIAPRKPNGDLPDITFLHLKSGSKLINAGVNVGLPYNDSAPDLGCFEFSSGPVVTYYNVEQSATFNRNNCKPDETGSAVTYTVPAKKYSSTVSQADADSKAAADITINGQNYANANGTCAVVPSFKSNAYSKTVNKNDCLSGVGTNVTYSVPKGKYVSSLSQRDADQQAIDDANANAQKYANVNGICELRSL